MELIARQIVQLNNASETQDAFASLGPGGPPSSQTERTDYDVVTTTFTKPSWATRATVMVSATVQGSGTVNSPIGFTALYARIAGTNSRNFEPSFGTAPTESQVYSGGFATGERAYALSTPASGSLTFTRTLDISDSTLDCNVRISKPFTGAGAGYSAAIVATVFWFAT